MKERRRNRYAGLIKTARNLKDKLIADAKGLVASRQTSRTRMIDESQQVRLRPQAPKRSRILLPVYQGRGGLEAGVDPLNNKAALDAMDDSGPRP